MARETQKEKIARLETELAQAITQRDAAIADALASNSKLNAKHDVSDSPMYQSLLLDREQWKKIAKNRQDQIRKNELRYDELLTMYKDLEQQLKESQAMLVELQTDKETALKAEKNPFGAGRKREHTEQLEKIMELHAQGLSHRAISEIVKVPSATVGRYIKQMNQNNIDL